MPPNVHKTICKFFCTFTSKMEQIYNSEPLHKNYQSFANKIKYHLTWKSSAMMKKFIKNTWQMTFCEIAHRLTNKSFKKLFLSGGEAQDKTNRDNYLPAIALLQSIQADGMGAAVALINKYLGKCHLLFSSCHPAGAVTHRRQRMLFTRLRKRRCDRWKKGPFIRLPVVKF